MPEKREAQDREDLAQVAKQQPNQCGQPGLLAYSMLCSNRLAVQYNGMLISLAAGSQVWLKRMALLLRALIPSQAAGCGGDPFLSLTSSCAPQPPPLTGHCIIPVGTTYPDRSTDRAPTAVYSGSPALSSHPGPSGRFSPLAH